MFQNLSCIREDLPSLDFPTVSKQALSKARQFINPSLFKELFYLSVDLFYSQLPSRRLWHGYHLLRLMVPKLSFQTLLPILTSSAKCLAIRTLPGGLPWVSPPSFTMFLTTTSSIPFFQAIPRMVPLTLMSVSLKSLLMTAQKNISLPTFSIRSSHRQCFRNFIFIAGRLCRYRHMGH